MIYVVWSHTPGFICNDIVIGLWLKFMNLLPYLKLLKIAQTHVKQCAFLTFNLLGFISTRFITLKVCFQLSLVFTVTPVLTQNNFV